VDGGSTLSGGGPSPHPLGPGRPGEIESARSAAQLGCRLPALGPADQITRTHVGNRPGAHIDEATGRGEQVQVGGADDDEADGHDTARVQPSASTAQVDPSASSR
jgi:hypothetical protein